MKINLEKKCIEFNGRNIDFEHVIDVKKINVTLKEFKYTGWFSGDYVNITNLPVVCIQLYNNKLLYFYDNKDELRKVLECIRDKKLEGVPQIFDSEKGKLEKGLWIRLFSCAFFRYGIDADDYERSLYDGKTCIQKYGFWASEYYKKTDSKDKPLIEVEDINAVYNMFVSVLPQNRDKTLFNDKKNKATKLSDYIAKICVDIERPEKYVESLENQNGNDYDKWEKSFSDLEECKHKIKELESLKYYQATYTDNCISFVDFCQDYCNKRRLALRYEIQKAYEKQNEERAIQALEYVKNHYESVECLKKKYKEKLLESSFQELQHNKGEFESEKSQIMYSLQFAIGISDGGYRELYNHASNVINYRMQSYLQPKFIREYPASMPMYNRPFNEYLDSPFNTREGIVSKKEYEKAQMYFYEVDSLERLNEILAKEKYKQNKSAGEKGEQKVEYALKWLDKSYEQIRKESVDMVGNPCIYLLNKDFIDEKQEYDHILVSNKGVFLIETKNWVGEINIDKNGNWVRIRDSKKEGIKNPLQQVRQHEKLLRSILPNKCSITSIICIANDKAVLTGIENCPIPIVKSDLLVEFIENYNTDGSVIDDDVKAKCINAIYEHMVK